MLKILAAALCAGVGAVAGVPTAFSVSKTLGSHMVLDWNWPVVWGFDVPGSQVKVSLVGTSDSIVTQAVGCHWLDRDTAPLCVVPFRPWTHDPAGFYANGPDVVEG